MSWIRVAVAAGISIVLPGAGHALLRDWLRAGIFASVYVSVLYYFLPPDELADAVSLLVSGSVVAGFQNVLTVITEGTDPIGQVTIFFIVMYATTNATFRAIGLTQSTRSPGTDGPSCPSCGRELDAELDFCHWCTTRLEPEPETEHS